MFGVVLFLIGIVLTANPYSRTYPAIFIISGNTYWGSLIYISAGSLSVAAQNKLHPCVVKASLAMNVISAITAATSITLMGIEMYLLSTPYHRCYYNYGSTDYNICSDFKKYEMGITGVMLVFSILQFIVSIRISGFACKATCNTDSTVVNVALNQSFYLRTVVILLVFTIPQFILSICISAVACKASDSIHSTVITVALNKVKASLGMNVISAVTAGIAILLMAADMIITLTYINYYYNSNYGYIYSQGFRLGILGILLVFCILQLIISIFISAFACKATSSTDPTLVHVALNRMKASLVMNVLSSITAGLAILLMGIELGLGANSSKYRSCIHGYACIEEFMCPYFERYDLGILGILLVFFILQFIISIFIPAFACKATSSTDPTMINVALIGGITYWGSLIYITAGSLSVAAQKKLDPCMVKSKRFIRMESNRVITSDKATVIIQVNPQVAQDTVICEDEQQTVQIMTGVIVFILGIVLTVVYDRWYNISVISGITYWGSIIYICTGSLSVAAQNKLHPCVAHLGITGVLLVFSILQFIVSIFISGFACKATCNTDSTVVNVALK
ncbi:membrane-spanning 4-domains subfamily A member 4A-like protein [Labeo rohita]|uniref:Membrane-spanning 4-domains subfamily A member 4A-like protein n=1 Tax=Labeo rohita TaxID=84645 RepID=A0A498NC28_LABRO|nr:membrane-spanning 4-domains subfamily A member 4A-like protein [Labeo rohita]